MSKTSIPPLMKRSLAVSILIVILLVNLLQAQETDSRILMKVAGRDVTAGEFIRMFNKSYEPGNLKELDNYLQQFVNFKLKVADAVSEGYDTTRAFREELAGYREQLAQSYLTDQSTREKVLKQAYQRSLTEINAWHILVSLSPDANPDDTAKAWKKAVYIRERVVQGESFEDVARSSSDDPSVKVNGGNLGYFTVFQMIMPFEDAAYSLKKGEISQPVRTPYGYHIIRVADRRPAGGKIKVAHIMITVLPGTDPEKAKAAEDTINVIYNKLKQGSTFAELAMKYSDHKESSAKGGELNWFGAGEIIPDFAEAAFALKNNGDFSKPVRTVYGWHIIKRIDRKAVESFDEAKPYLESRLSDSYLNSISRKSFIEKLKKEYKLRINPAAFNWFVKNTDTLIIQGKAKYSRKDMPSGPIYTFADQQMNTREFAGYIEKRGERVATTDSLIFINRTLETAIADHLFKYENSVLEKKYPEFRYLMAEFHDGILLFEISGRKVWNRIQEDSAGLVKFYNDNISRYLTKESFKGKIYSLSKSDSYKALETAYKKYSAKPGCDDLMARKFVHRKDSLLSIERGTWKRGENAVFDQLKWKEGYYKGRNDSISTLIVIESVKAPEPIPLSEIQGAVMSDWQDYLEKSWLEQLKKKYAVSIDSNIFEQIRKKLNNE